MDYVNDIYDGGVVVVYGSLECVCDHFECYSFGWQVMGGNLLNGHNIIGPRTI